MSSLITGRGKQDSGSLIGISRRACSGLMCRRYCCASGERVLLSVIGSDGSLKKMFSLVVAGETAIARTFLVSSSQYQLAFIFIDTFSNLFRVRSPSCQKPPTPNHPRHSHRRRRRCWPPVQNLWWWSSTIRASLLLLRRRQWLGGIRGAMQLLVDRVLVFGPCLPLALIGMTQRVGHP